MDRFKLDAAYEALLFSWEICPNKASCLRPLSEVCRNNGDADWKSIERTQIGKIYK